MIALRKAYNFLMGTRAFCLCPSVPSITSQTFTHKAEGKNHQIIIIHAGKI
jgi:hypothetical protein